jgi:UDPglucose 6-dehydrogenase
VKITIIGTGYVGLVSGACLSEIGNDVLCLDLDRAKVDALNSGKVPIYEPGLDALVKQNITSGRLRFTVDVEDAVEFGTLQVIAVGTPSEDDGAADLRYVFEAARNLGRHMTSYKVVIGKSTVPVGTADRVRQVICAELAARRIDVPFSIVSNPEFLKEGAAVDDFMKPDRIVIGVEDDHARQVMRTLYAPFQRNHERMLMMDLRSAELTKYAANAMLATRISFMNELANLAEKLGADIEQVRQGMGSDHRIGYHFLYAGCGYGGSCFPKDVRALQRSASLNDMRLKILAAVDEVNELQKGRLVEKLTARLGENLEGRQFAVWGLAFKPGTDDMREAPSRTVIDEILRRGGSVRAYDPVATDEARRIYRHETRVVFSDSRDAALEGADGLLIVTEWKEFRSPDFAAIKKRLKLPLIFDGRNLYDPDVAATAGLEYFSIGRPTELNGASDNVDVSDHLRLRNSHG